MVHCLRKSESGVSVLRFSVHLPIRWTEKSDEKVVTEGKPLKFTVKESVKWLFFLDESDSPAFITLTAGFLALQFDFAYDFITSLPILNHRTRIYKNKNVIYDKEISFHSTERYFSKIIGTRGLEIRSSCAGYVPPAPRVSNSGDCD